MKANLPLTHQVINLGIATLTLFPLIGFLSGSPIPIDPTLAAQVFFLVSVWWALLMVGMCSTFCCPRLYFSAWSTLLILFSGTEAWIILIHVGWSVLSGVQMIRYGFTDRYDMVRYPHFTPFILSLFNRQRIPHDSLGGVGPFLLVGSSAHWESLPFCFLQKRLVSLI